MNDQLKYPLLESLEWGPSRHRLVARLAEENIQSANAKNVIAGLLSDLNATNLADIANWADVVKDFPKPKPNSS